jgi:hypothetical protein
MNWKTIRCSWTCTEAGKVKAGKVEAGSRGAVKYILCEDFSGRPIPFLFPGRVAHLDMREQLPYARVLSAGYIVLEGEGFVCSGGDAEIGAHSRPEDAECIAAFFRDDDNG